MILNEFKPIFRRRSKIKAKLKLTLLGKLALVLMLLAVVSLTGCSGAARLGWAGTLVHEYTTQADGEDPVDHAVLFVGTMEGELAAYDLLDADRKRLWSQKVGDDAVLYGRPVASGEYVYIASYTDADSVGGVLWKFNADANAEAPDSVALSSKVVGGVEVGLGKVYVGTEDGVLHALNADTLVEEWKYPAGDTTLSDRIWGTPTLDIDEGVIYFGCFNNKFYALDAVTGEEKWDPFETGGAIGGKPLVYDGKVYFGSFDRKFYALDKATGKEAWTTPFTAGKWFWTEPIVYDDTIYVGCLDHKLYALDAATGTKESEFTTDAPITSPPVAATHYGANKVLGDDDDVDIIIVASNKGSVFALAPANLAAEAWNSYFPLGESIQSPMSVYGNLVYVYGSNSTLTAAWLINGEPFAWEKSTAP